MKDKLNERSDTFDFERHGRIALGEYLKRQQFFLELALKARQILDEASDNDGIRLHSISARAKSPESFQRKAEIISKTDPGAPKYKDPLSEITDLAAVRVITYFPKTVKSVEKTIEREFAVVEKIDKTDGLLESDTFGYQSVHYLVQLGSKREVLPEYKRFSDAIFEIQVRTILQHAWAEIEHDIQYKSTSSIPGEIRRRFVLLAGILEVADNEFQAIQDADDELAIRSQQLITSGQLKHVELTPRTLKFYLDNKIGADGRMTNTSYDWEVKKLKFMGFRNLGEVHACIKPYNDDQVSSVLSRNREGQLQRFDYLLLAGMGENYIDRYIFSDEDWYDGVFDRNQLRKLAEAGIEIGSYLPSE